MNADRFVKADDPLARKANIVQRFIVADALFCEVITEELRTRYFSDTLAERNVYIGRKYFGVAGTESIKL